MTRREIAVAFATMLVMTVAEAQVPPAPTPMTPMTPTPMGQTPPATPAETPPTQPMNPMAPMPPAAAPGAAWPTAVGGKDLATWIKEMVESKDGWQRETAVKVIPYFGPAARATATKPLIRRLSDETDPGVRMNLVLVLGMIGADKPEDARSICDALNGIIVRAANGSAVRLHATRSLSAYGQHAVVAIPSLDAISEDPSWETRQSVVMTLGRIGRATDPKKGPNMTALNSLIKRLAKEESIVVRLEIAQALLIVGPPLYKADVPGDYARVIKPYLDAVTKQLEKETDDATKVWLTMVHMSYDGTVYNETTIAKIADYMNKPDLYAKFAALRALALLGEKAKPALAGIMGMLKSDDPTLVAEAMSSLAALKTQATPALAELEKIKAGNNPQLKAMAAITIDAINGKPPAK